ncbi:uncharacterized protein LOC121856498 [Homarus americanus]|uniref:uncharacterized protein LOC121856498 n=1 Tax=Homarus americanus TaxID=6706 RepID=UPI001C466244|nr:uncharacterized protein LOC121856498 [Homarus americanus]
MATSVPMVTFLMLLLAIAFSTLYLSHCLAPSQHLPQTTDLYLPTTARDETSTLTDTHTDGGSEKDSPTDDEGNEDSSTDTHTDSGSEKDSPTDGGGDEDSIRFPEDEKDTHKDTDEVAVSTTKTVPTPRQLTTRDRVEDEPSKTTSNSAVNESSMTTSDSSVNESWRTTPGSSVNDSWRTTPGSSVNDSWRTTYDSSVDKPSRTTSNRILNKTLHYRIEKNIQEKEQIYNNNNNTNNKVEDEGSTRTSDSGLDDAWYSRVGSRLWERARRVKEVCAMYGDAGQSLKTTSWKFLYYSSRYNLMVCVAPKVASSTWFGHLLTFRGVFPHDARNLHTDYWKSFIKSQKVLGKIGTSHHLRTANTVITSRHPLERLLSVYRDKYLGGRSLPPGSHGTKCFRYFWRPLLKALNITKPTPYITFNDFLRYVLKNHHQHTLANPHWMRLLSVCSPCHVAYKYVLRLETFIEDLQYLSRDLNITSLDLQMRRNVKSDDNDTSPSSSPSSSSALSWKEESTSLLKNSTLRYYLSVPPSLLAQVLDLYKLDLEMFGYQVQKVLTQYARGQVKPAPQRLTRYAREDQVKPVPKLKINHPYTNLP